jgi:RNA polymerase sigma factor (sigma-70 family)
MADVSAPLLLPRIAAGDEAAVRACLDRYGGLVWSLAVRMLASQADAEDAVQEVFVDLWRNAGRFDPAVASESTFVTLVARRRLIDRRRRAGRHPEALPLPESLPTAGGGLEAVESADEARRALAALQALPEAQREALRLAIWQGMTHEQVARTLGLPLGTAKAHLRRGLIRLRELLGGQACPSPAEGGAE